MLAIAVAAAATALALATPASAVSPAVSVSPPLVTGLAGPLGLSVKGDGTIYVAQSFTGILTTVAPDGTRRDLVHAPGEIAGLLARSNSSAVYTFTGGTQRHPVTTLNKVTRSGEVTQLGDLYAHELQDNPDAHANYGFQGLSAACARKVPPQVGWRQAVRRPGRLAPVRRRRAAGTEPLRSPTPRPTRSCGCSRTTGSAPSRCSRRSRTSSPPRSRGACTCRRARWVRVYNFEPVPTDVTVGPDWQAVRDHPARRAGERGAGRPRVGLPGRRDLRRARSRSRPASSARPTWRSTHTAGSTSPSCSPDGCRTSTMGGRCRWSAGSPPRPRSTSPAGTCT